MRRYPLRHLSLRVPWHDNAWNGTVCNDPVGNMACLALKSIGPKRNDALESANRDKSLDIIPEDDRPCCVSERGFFMAPFDLTRTKKHPYVETSPETHGHFRDTIIRQPSYSADAIPFRWMRNPERWMSEKKHNEPDFRDRYNLLLDQALEPDTDSGRRAVRHSQSTNLKTTAGSTT